MENSTFKDLIQDPFILKSLMEYGFEEPTQIQYKAIPAIKEGKDVVGQSSTGSGKTIAFAIPILEMIKATEGLQVLIIAPTRELSNQIGKEFERLSKYKQINIVIFYGGVGIEPQIHKFKTAHIAIGTPGRLLDLMERRAINLNNIKTLVLDEADKMFEMGFIQDIRRILNALNRKRQTLMFSATFSQEIMKIANEHMRDPLTIKAKQYVEKDLLKQYFYITAINDRFSLLAHLLKNETANLAVVFCGTRRAVDMVEYNLKRHGFDAKAIHGGLSQNQRTQVIEDFHSNKIHILVASDLAARGLDIKNLTHVYNYDIPKTSKEYLHRIGRTARAGESGKAISLLSEKDYDNFRKVQEDRSLKIERLETPPFTKVNFQPFVPTQGGFQRRDFRQSGRFTRDKSFNKFRRRF